MYGDIVCAFVDLIEINDFNALFSCNFFGDKWIIGDHIHLEPLSERGNHRANPAETDYANGFIKYFSAREAFLVPFFFFHGGICLGYISGEGHHHGNGVLCSGNGIAPRGVHHHDAMLTGCLGVYIIYTSSCTTDDLEILGCSDNICSGFC